MMLGAITRHFTPADLLPESYDAYFNRHPLNDLRWDIKCFDVPAYLRTVSSGCTRGNAGGEDSETPLDDPNACCRVHGGPRECYGPTAHKECDYGPALYDALERSHRECKGLKLSDFPSRLGKGVIIERAIQHLTQEKLNKRKW
jgi:hypothetical protein